MMEQVNVNGRSFWKDEDGDYYNQNRFGSMIPIHDPTKKKERSSSNPRIDTTIKEVNPHVQSYLNKIDGIGNEKEIYEVEIKDIGFKSVEGEEYEVMDFSQRTLPGGASELLKRRNRGEKSEWKNLKKTS